MGKIISISNQKGGVGKTTTAVNLSASLAEANQRVLLIDFDPQGNAGSGFGVEAQDIEYSIYDALIGEKDIDDIILYNIKDNMDFVPSDLNLAAIESEFADMRDKNLVLKNIIKDLKSSYDYIILDCPPSLGTLTVNALTCSDTVIIPIQCEYYALEGLGQILNSIRIVKGNLNKSLEVEGILFTMYDGRNKLSQEVVDTVSDNYDGYIFKTIIPRNVRLAEAPSFGKSIIAYDSSSTGANRYREMAAELMMKEME